MTYHLKKNTSSPSTTWVAKPDRMRGSRREGQQNGPKAPSFRNLRRRDPKERLTITVAYRAGSEAWWLIEARGVRQAFPGHLCLHDVLMRINNVG